MREVFEMKKRFLHLSAILIVTVLLLAAVVSVSAGGRVTVPCTETFLATLDPGVWTYPGGNIHIRGMVNQYQEGSTDPRNVGINTVTINANWKPDYTGPMWGTFHLLTDEGGEWYGSWNGTNSAGGADYHAIGNGIGLYEGQMSWVDVQYGVCTVTYQD
jgi:hypothetical protein